MLTVYLPASDRQVTLLRYMCYGIVLKTLEEELPVRELGHILTCSATFAQSSHQIFP
jgi:hypothetical protein